MGEGGSDYVEACPTINLAVLHSILTDVGGVDESFSRGSDTNGTSEVWHR
jgi:hypothetical protein